MQEHSPAIKLIARLHEQKNEIENLQISIDTLHKEKEIFSDSLERKRNLNIVNYRLLQKFSQNKIIAQEKDLLAHHDILNEKLRNKLQEQELDLRKELRMNKAAEGFIKNQV